MTREIATSILAFTCAHCRHGVVCDHPDDHPQLCCDCFDLSLGHPLDDLNEERAGKNLPPIEEPWPGLRRDGEPIDDYEEYYE